MFFADFCSIVKGKLADIFIDTFRKLRKATVCPAVRVCLLLLLSVCLSVCLHGMTSLPMEGFFMKFNILAFCENV